MAHSLNGGVFVKVGKWAMVGFRRTASEEMNNRERTAIPSMSLGHNFIGL
jgi:hypothetical protein